MSGFFVGAAALTLLGSCASPRFEGVLPSFAQRTRLLRPIEILYTGDMAGHVEPCG